MSIWRVSFNRGNEYFRPDVTIEYRRGRFLVIFFGWQKPSVLWL